MTHDWVSFKEREPTTAELPVEVFRPHLPNELWIYRPGDSMDVDHNKKNGTFWRPHVAPEPLKPQVFLRHYDGREEEIEGPVYIFPETIETGDEWVVVTDIGEVQWVRCLKPSDENPKRVRRRIA